jgi:IS4 transposase
MVMVFTPAGDDLIASDFGDLRLSRRLCEIVDCIAAKPGGSLPAAMVSSASREALYRFLRNSRVTPRSILDPYLAATADRAEGYEQVVVIHDTTEFEFNGKREGLGRVNTKGDGFFLHCSLVVGATDGKPLGLLSSRTWTRTDPVLPKAQRKSFAHHKRSKKESDRWRDAMRESQARLPVTTKAIHVADREGDQFRVYDELLSSDGDFVVRVMHKDRVLLPNEDGHHNIEQAINAASVVLEREVKLSARGATKHYRTPHPARPARTARLEVSATRVAFKRSWAIYKHETAASLSMNVVRVFEPRPPKGQAPVEWVLTTTLPIDTREQVAFIVDCYRQRWLIEEFFKALKTGCRYEDVQLESATTLLNLLAIMLPIACRLLLLRQLARTEAPASDVLTPTQIRALRMISPVALGKHPTAREALLAIAQVGGHIKSNGEPGWLVLYRGFKDLLLVEIGVTGVDVINH